MTVEAVVECAVGRSGFKDDFDDASIHSFWVEMENLSSATTWTESGGNLNFSNSAGAVRRSRRKWAGRSFGSKESFTLRGTLRAFSGFAGHASGDGFGISLDQNDDADATTILVQGSNGIEVALITTTGTDRILRITKRVADSNTTLSSTSLAAGTNAVRVQIARVSGNLTVGYNTDLSDDFTTIGTYDVSAMTATLDPCLAVTVNSTSGGGSGSFENVREIP